MAVIATSCRDDLRTGNGRNDGRIAFSIDSSNDWQTRAAADSSAIETYHIQQKVMPVIVGNDTLMLTLTIEPNIGIDAPAPAETRAAPVTTATLNGFNMKAYMDDNGQLFFSKYYAWSEGQVVNTEHFWPNKRTVTFCADAMQTVKNYGHSASETVTFNPTYTMSDGKVTGTFDYTSPISGANDNHWFDALVQPDPVVAIKPNQAKQESNVPLKFHHPLAAIRFRVGTVPENIKVRDTYLKNIYQKGTCSFVSSVTDDITFTWTGQNNVVNYIQSNWKTVYKGTSTADNPTEIHDGSTTFDDCTFFVVPQKLADNAELGFDYHVAPERNQETDAWEPNDKSDDTRYTIFKAFKAFGVTELEADKRYTFTLSLAGSMGISVTDDCTSTVKSNVVIKNTGKSTGYVRAAIVGWWKNTAGNIVAPWNDLPNETCTYGKYSLPGSWS
ncbi:MAG: fimbrillin family protein, partial [Candidatus Limisoma sp.]|nr:fimbrillin family protein [Candidatus Limisoma sp.]